MDEFDKLELGTPEAAVRSCVGLLAQLFHLNEGRLAYYLDLYWQLRQAYERDKARQELIRAQPDGAPVALAYRDPPRTLNRPAAPEAKEDAAPQSSEGEETAREEKFAEVLASINAGEPPPRKTTSDHVLGNHHAAEAAAEKRRIRERLMQMRDQGVTTPKIVRTANGAITEDQIRAIIDTRLVPIAVYRVLDKALETLAAAPPEK